MFTTRGGALKSWRLKKYQDAAGQPLELVPQQRSARHDRGPSRCRSDDPAVARDARAGALQAERRPSVRVTGAPATLTFDYQDASGLTARKDFTFSPD